MWVELKDGEAIAPRKWLKASALLNAFTCVATVTSAALITGYGVQQARLEQRITSLEQAQSQQQQESQPAQQEQQRP